MDLWDMVRIIFRRWYVAAPIVAIGAFLALVQVPIGASYTSSATIFMAAPRVEVVPNEQVAVVGAFDGDPRAVANVAAVVLMSPVGSGELELQGFDSDYEVSVEPNDPFAQIEIESETSAQAANDIVLISQWFVDEAVNQQIQFGATNDELVTATVLAIDTPAATYGARRRAQALVMAAAIILAILAAVGVDALLAWRRRRRQRRRAAESGQNADLAGTPDEHDFADPQDRPEDELPSVPPLRSDTAVRERSPAGVGAERGTGSASSSNGQPHAEPDNAQSVGGTGPSRVRAESQRRQSGQRSTPGQ